MNIETTMPCLWACDIKILYVGFNKPYNMQLNIYKQLIMHELFLRSGMRCLLDA